MNDDPIEGAEKIQRKREELIARAFEIPDSTMAAIRADDDGYRAAREEADKQRDTLMEYVQARMDEMVTAAYERALCLNCGCTPMWRNPGAVLWCPMCGAERPDERLRLDLQRPRDMFGRVDPGVVADPGVHLSWPWLHRAYRAVAVWVGTLRTGR